MSFYPLLAPDTLEVQQWCETYHLNRIDQPIEQPFLQWGNPLQLVMDQRPVNMAQPASRLKGHLLLKAFANHRHLTVFDATAGLLGDAQIILALQHTVIACEQHPMLAALIQSFCQHHHLENTLKPLFGDAHHYITQQSVDVVIIDPMFDDPKQTPKSKKHMQSIQSLVPQKDLSSLLPIALKQARLKVLVKQHASASPWLPNQVNHQLSSKKLSFRWDVYTP